jgi:hypothetical protein
MSARRSLLMGTLLSLALGMSARADMIEGSLSLAGVGVTQNGANLGVSTKISADDNIVVSQGIGDYVWIPSGFPLTIFESTAIDLQHPETGFGGYTLSNTLWGDFTASSGEIVKRTTSYLDILMTGVFDPGPGMQIHSFSDTPSTLRISINQSGSSLSEAITLESPAVPEPSSWILGGTGLLGLLFLGRRKIHA